MRTTTLILVLLAGACQAGSSSRPSGEPTSARVVAVVDGQPVRAVVPPQLLTDPDAYRDFARQVIYRHALVREAEAGGVQLTAAERAAAHASVPPAEVLGAWLAERGQTRADLLREAEEVALVQKLERRQVFDRITVTAEDIQAAFAERARPTGPRRFLTAVALQRAGCEPDQLAAASRLAAALEQAPVDGHRIDVAAAAAAAGMAPAEVWAIDLHYDGEWQLAATSVPPAYRAVAAGFGPAQLEALGQLLPGHQGGRTFGPECGDGLVWMAVFTGDTGTRALELADVADEIEAVLRGERERGQFDRFVADTLAAVDAEIVEVTPC